MSKQAKLSVAVQKMYKVNAKWGLILDERDPHLTAYDPDSRHELSLYAGSASRYEAVMRLLPDIFVKAYKSVELAKLWWSQAERLYAHKPLTRRTVTELVKQEVDIEHRIVKIADDIERFESTLLVRTDDLAKLSERENRFHSLSAQRESLEERKDVATQALNTVLAQLERMTQQLQLYQEGSHEYVELERRLKLTDKQLAITKDELKILAYHFHIVQEDFNLELELQPHLIRFRADIEEKMSELQKDLRAKQTEKRNTKKKLVLLKANCERMREIMHRYHMTDGSLESLETSRENTESFAATAAEEKDAATAENNKAKTAAAANGVRKTQRKQQSKPAKTQSVSNVQKPTVSSVKKTTVAK